MKTITRKVVSYCEIPEDIQKPSWLEEVSCDTYVECHIHGDEPDSELEKWLLKTYPELKKEKAFLIHIDY